MPSRKDLKRVVVSKGLITPKYVNRDTRIALFRVYLALSVTTQFVNHDSPPFSLITGLFIRANYVDNFSA